MESSFNSKFLISSLFILAVCISSCFAAAATTGGGGSASVAENVIQAELQATKTKTVKASNSRCISDSDCTAGFGSDGQCDFGICYYCDSDEYWTGSYCRDIDDDVKVAAGIIIALAICIPLIIIFSICACCFCCAGCAGHAWRQRRNQPPTQQIIVGGYDQHGNFVPYGTQPPNYGQNPNPAVNAIYAPKPGPPPYPTQRQSEIQNQQQL